ncbi:hypothetical protein GCK32_007699, partial [Trichostrongylus colubriformis]
ILHHLVTKGAFHVDEQNLLEKISQMSIFFDHRSGQSTFNVKTATKPFYVKNILQQIKGLYVRTTYGKRKTFPIGNIGAPANGLKFQTADGGQCTVEQYFKKHYNIQLKYPGMFTVSERHNQHTHYPVELLTVAPSQRVKLQQQTPDQVASMIKASAILPNVRLRQTKVMKDALEINARNPQLSAAGIAVNNSFTTVPGRILPTPTIVYGGSQNVKPVDNVSAVNYFYIVIEHLIKLLEIEYQIVSQEVKGSKVDTVLFKNQNQTLDNVVAKINMKLGGMNYAILVGSRPNHPSSKWLNDKDRLFVGFEILNPPALSKMEIERGATYKMPSVLGWGANCAANPQQYLGDYVFIEPFQSDGTAKTPKYSLLADDSKIPLDIIEGMTHGLCYLHEIVTSTVSVPVPLIVADRCAKRGHNVFIANLGQGRAAVSSIEEANEKLVNHGELQKVRYNA